MVDDVQAKEAGLLHEYIESGFIKIAALFDDTDFTAVESDLLPLIREYVAADSIQDEKWVSFAKSNPDAVSRIYDRFRDHPSLHKLGNNPKLKNIIRLLLPKAQLYKKLPFRIDVPFVTKELAYWHQDHYYVQGNTDEITVWMPFQDTGILQGCLAVMPRSHKLGTLEHTLMVGKKSIPDGVYDNEIKLVEMKRGDVLIFSALLLHSSQLNISDNIRYSAQLRYTNPESGISPNMGGLIE